MNRSIASVTAAGMLLLIGLALPPPGTADDQTPPDQSPDITERGVGGVVRPQVTPMPEILLEVAPPPPPDLIVPGSQNPFCQQVSGLVPPVRMVFIGLGRNQGTGPAGGFFTEVTSFNRRIRLRRDSLPPGGAFGYPVQVDCPPQGPCPVTVTVDVNGEVTESDETNNVFSFTCP